MCTDGGASDKSPQFYDSVTEYCKNNGFTKINIITFEETDCDLISLAKLSFETKAKLSKTSDALKFDSFFSEIVTETSKTSMAGKVNLKLLSDYDHIKIDHKNYLLEQKNIDMNEKELLFEINVDSSKINSEFVYFQFQLDTEHTTRVFTTKIKLSKSNDTNQSRITKEIVHASSLRKLFHFIIVEKNLAAAESFLVEYGKFNQKNNESSEIVKKITELIKNLKSCNLREDQVATLFSINNMCSLDIDCSKEESKPIDYEVIGKIQGKNENEFENVCNNIEKRNLREFVIKKDAIFDKFEKKLKYQLEKEENIIKLLTVAELIEQASKVICIINSIKNQDSSISSSSCSSGLSSCLLTAVNDDKSENQSKEDKLNSADKESSFEQIFEKIYNDFSSFDGIYDNLRDTSLESDEWFDEKVLNELAISLNKFIQTNQSETENLIASLDGISFKLIQQSKLYAEIMADQSDENNNRLLFKKKTEQSATRQFYMVEN